MRVSLSLVALLCFFSAYVVNGASVIVIQPISVCSDLGANCSNFGEEYFEAETDKIWAQADIDVSFLPMSQLNSSAFQTIDNVSEFSSLANGAGNGQNASATVINMWFVSEIVGSGTIYGLGFQPGNGIAIADDTFDTFEIKNEFGQVVGQVVGRRDTIAHEIGHNLGLAHTGDANTRLMAPGSLRGIPTGVGSIFPDGGQASQLTAGEISTAQSSSFVTAVPEPGAYAVIALVGCGSLIARRRIRGSQSRN